MANERFQPADVAVFILAGGRGTRLQRAWKGPKALVPVGDRPFLAYLLDELDRAGFERVILLTGDQGEAVEEAFSDREVTALRERTPLGTGGALRAAAPLARAANLILNGDSHCRLDWTAFLREAAANPQRLTVVAARMEDAADYGTIEVDAGGLVTGFREKAQGAGLVNAGIYLARGSFFVRDLAEEAGEDPLSLEKTVLPAMARERELACWETERRFWDIGTPERLEQFRREMERERPA
ncbi:MAG: NTP transferase domain-containing protein [Candidatus Eisenbacteria bacterium]|nr:NTP transferase domain-containing protein [Candidatus Eisenbacteria bacterium]